MLTGLTIKNQHADVFTFLNGNLERPAGNCKVPEEALPGSLVYASTRDHVLEALRHEPAILILSSQLAGSYGDLPNSDTCCFSVRNISMGMAVLLKYFDRSRCASRNGASAIRPRSCMRDAQIGEGCVLGPLLRRSGPHAVIGDRLPDRRACGHRERRAFRCARYS